MTAVSTSYVAQYLPPAADPAGGWKDLSGWDAPGDAFGQARAHRITWDKLTEVTDGRPQAWRVIRRLVSEDVITDPREMPK